MSRPIFRDVLAAIEVTPFIGGYFEAAIALAEESARECSITDIEDITLVAYTMTCRAALALLERDHPEYGWADDVQAGIDLYLTQLHHGTGFWDRPERYGEVAAKRGTDIAQMFSEDLCLELEESGCVICMSARQAVLDGRWLLTRAGTIADMPSTACVGHIDTTIPHARLVYVGGDIDEQRRAYGASWTMHEYFIGTEYTKEKQKRIIEALRKFL